MKKLLFFALAANVAMAQEDSFAFQAKEAAQEVGEQFAEVVVVPAQAVKDATYTAAGKIKDVTYAAAGKVTDAAHQVAAKTQDVANTVKNSELVQEASDVASQFAGAPREAAQEIKAGYQATTAAISATGRKIADSKFVANVKKANQVLVNATKKVTSKIKATAHDIANSEAVEDAKDVMEQFAQAPREAWLEISAFFTAVKNKVTN